jgi:predicted NBD/HSP70 family sugar kinase
VKIPHGASYVEVETGLIVPDVNTQLYYCGTRGRNSLKTNTSRGAMICYGYPGTRA